MSTNHPSETELVAELEGLQAQTEDKLGELAEKYVALKFLKERTSKACTAALKELQAKMEEQGMKRMGTEGANISISTAHGFRIKEGTDPDDILNNTQYARDWVEKYNPQGVSTTQAVLKNTFEAYLEAEGGDAVLPKFLEETTLDTLSVRKARA